MSTTRLEAFSDAVMAIAITLLVLDLAVPERAESGHHLAGDLAAQWPAYSAYVVSFLVVGIIWVNHHQLIAMAATVTRPILYANLALLLAVSTTPFPTRLFAEYLSADDADAHTAAAVYSATTLAMGLLFSLLFAAVTRDNANLRQPLSPARRRAMWWRFSGGGVLYLAALVLAFFSAPAVLLLNALVGIYYAVDPLDSFRQRTSR